MPVFSFLAEEGPTTIYTDNLSCYLSRKSAHKLATIYSYSSSSSSSEVMDGTIGSSVLLYSTSSTPGASSGLAIDTRACGLATRREVFCALADREEGGQNLRLDRRMRPKLGIRFLLNASFLECLNELVAPQRPQAKKLCKMASLSKRSAHPTPKSVMLTKERSDSRTALGVRE